MSDRPILKKPVRKGSLAKRVLWASALFVIFPLFIHTIFLYLHDYKGDVKTVSDFLQLICQGKVETLEEVIDQNKEFLGILSLDHIHGEVEKIEADPLGDPFFTRVDRQRGALWVGKNETSAQALGIEISLNDWLKKWKYLEKYEYPLFLLVQDEKSQVVVGAPLSQKSEEFLIEKKKISGTELTLILSVPLKAIREYELRYYAFSFFTLLVLIGLIGGSGVILFAGRVAKPFDALCQTMEKVSEGAVHARYKPDKMGFEINELGEQFNETLDELLRQREEAEKERLHRERLVQELKIGRKIQQSLLPSALPSFPNLDIAAGYLPAQEVSGDFYDLFQIDDSRFLCIVADSAGKGISACLYGLGFRSILRASALQSRSLDEIVKKANDLFLLDTGDSGFFITAFLGLYDVKTSKLEYCSQGHPPALFKRKDTLQMLSTGGLAFGIQPFEGNKIEQIDIFPEDVLLLYTDGVLDAHYEGSHFFGIKRLQDFFLHNSFSSSSFLIDSLLHTIEEFSQNSPQYDDITLLNIKFFVE